MKVYEKNDAEFEFPEDMKLILDYLKAHGKILVKDSTIENLYFVFSDVMYCAGWMRVDDDILEEFANWLDGYDI